MKPFSRYSIVYKFFEKTASLLILTTFSSTKSRGLFRSISIPAWNSLKIQVRNNCFADVDVQWSKISDIQNNITSSSHLFLAVVEMYKQEF